MSEAVIRTGFYGFSSNVRENFQDQPGWLYFIGATHILVGLLAVLMPFVASLAVELTVGVLLTISGLFYGYQAFRSHGRSSTFTNIVLSLGCLFVGLSFLAFTGLGRLSLAMVAAVLFLVIGFSRLIEVFSRNPVVGRGWLILSTVANLFLGGLILYGLPGSAFWIIGLLLGVDFLFIGFHMLGLGRDLGTEKYAATEQN